MGQHNARIPLQTSGNSGGHGLFRVLIVDDSAVAREVLGRMAVASGRFTIAGAVRDVAQALDLLSHVRVDVIVLDLNLPGVDGLTALPMLLDAGRGARVLIVTASGHAGSAPVVQAQARGQVDLLAKPGTAAGGSGFAAVLQERLLRLACAAEEGAVARRAMPDRFDIVAIGASTGGVGALGDVLRSVPETFRAPILVTQHLPPAFMAGFARQIALLARRPAQIATCETHVLSDHIYVAPGDGYLCLCGTAERPVIRLSHTRAATGCMPSVDPMFESVARLFGPRALGVVLTGMGRDGTCGAGAIVRAGGMVVVQDRGSSVVWGMPGSVLNAGHATAALPPPEIGRLFAGGGETR